MIDLSPSRYWIRGRFWQRMAFQPKRPRSGGGINPKPFPPGGFIAVPMHFAMMPSAEWDGEFVTDPAAERAPLGEAQMMRIAGCAAADQARLLGDIPDVLAIANAARLGQAEHAFVDAA